ncbi:CvfB family protein [Miniphocaeibacter massiliensis]|uniref:CvfB family protein n=1 Tax=Miniphocaeibacter massiliensis TaxID=2041841 RepID=UPI000C071123|nr:S1-like domain-containing RNA-binding protein [Miniphocaeibacter massiliensis]
MYELGEFQELEIIRIRNAGAFLGLPGSGKKDDLILLPGTELNEADEVGNILKVFIYKDHENRLIATKREPKITLGKIAYLEVKDITNIGAFLDWGLEKDLFMPFKEQTIKLEKGRKYLVALYIDKSDRLSSTMKIRDYLRTDSKYSENDWVDGIVYNIVDEIGAFVAIDEKYEALIPKEHIRGIIAVGEDVHARIASIKSDGRINLTMKNRGHLEIDNDSNTILSMLKENDGFLELNDKSSPGEIMDALLMTKSSFKKAVGRLLKHKKIEFYKNGIKIKK